MENKPWYKSAAGVIGVGGGIIAAAFGVVFILCTLDLIPQCREDTIITAIRPAELSPGQATVIIGENLDSVSEVYLTRTDTPPIPLYILRPTNTKINLNLPHDVEHGDYDIELIIGGQEPIATGHTLKVKLDPAIDPLPPPCPDDPIVFAGLDWNSVQMQNAIAMVILDYGYGCKVDVIEGSATPLFKSLVNGNLHVFMELWLPNYQEEWNEAIRQGSIIPLGRSLDDQWQSTFVVPTYVIKGDPSRGIEPMAPNLKTPEDIRQYKDVFATRTSGGKAVLFTCIEGWNCKDINPQKVKAYGLEDVIKLVDPGSANALFKSLEDAYQRGGPWLGYLEPILITQQPGKL